MENNKGSVVLSVILTVLVVGLVGYIVYDKVSAPKTSGSLNEGTKKNTNKEVTDNNEVSINYYKSYDITLNGKKITIGYVVDGKKETSGEHTGLYSEKYIKVYANGKQITTVNSHGDEIMSGESIDTQIKLDKFTGTNANSEYAEYATAEIVVYGWTYRFIIDDNGSIMYDAGGCNTEGISFKANPGDITADDYTKVSYTTNDDKKIDAFEHYERFMKNMNRATSTWDDYGLKRRIYVQDGVVNDRVIDLYTPNEIDGVGK